ncbi:related to GTP-binding protein rab4b [Rhynchosporium agropyri]|uniref:Related to GTP-binding protein rab4b n=1 Tax=Rhynchosporium agropyri TaxID=914238 RepID=A0A1E1KRD9_9HELO|nr:related to GTP-binding protein rab4b [Rhynchosporium agropyri]
MWDGKELGSMYDYLAKIILLGPSGSGKYGHSFRSQQGGRGTDDYGGRKKQFIVNVLNCRSCLLHRFVKNEWRIVSSQTIGVEFASKIIRVGTGARRKRIKLQVPLPLPLSQDFHIQTRELTDYEFQLWDTAGTERFRSVSRSYYRGAAGAILVYDISSHKTFTALPSFMNDARALASPNLTLLLAGNKADLADSGMLIDVGSSSLPPATPTSVSSRASSFPFNAGGSVSSNTGSGNGSVSTNLGLGTQLRATIAPNGREVSPEEASQWASKNSVPVSVEVSALNGDNVDEVFNRLARMILTKIELGEIDPDDPMSGIQYGDVDGWQGDTGGDGSSVKSGVTLDDGARRRKGAGNRGRGRGWGIGGGTLGGMREWEEVFTLSRSRRSNQGCC